MPKIDENQGDIGIGQGHCQNKWQGKILSWGILKINENIRNYYIITSLRFYWNKSKTKYAWQIQTLPRIINGKRSE